MERLLNDLMVSFFNEATGGVRNSQPSLRTPYSLVVVSGGQRWERLVDLWCPRAWGGRLRRGGRWW